MVYVIAILIVIALSAFFYFKFLIFRQVYRIEDVPHCTYTLVLGAGLNHKGLPTDILADRVLTAVKLFKLKKTDFLIMSGAGSKGDYCEPDSMKKLAIKNSVPEKVILEDLSGNSTLRSLIIFKNCYPDKRAIIITQKFHLFRSLSLATLIHIRVVGVPAELYQFSFLKKFIWNIREFIALPYNLLILFVLFIRKFYD